MRKEPEGNFKIFMIDFALCCFRREYKSENDWRNAKQRKMKRGALEFVMQGYLQGDSTYHGLLSEKLDEDYMMSH